MANKEVMALDQANQGLSKYAQKLWGLLNILDILFASFILFLWQTWANKSATNYKSVKMGEVIGCWADIWYVHSMLEKFLARTPQASVAKGVEDDNYLTLVSPDSRILCDDPDCPIGYTHCRGRYYHDGERPPPNPTEADYKTAFGGMKVPVAHAFNYTVPPPEIVAAYLRITEYRAQGDDLDIIRVYQMHHMWSPLESEHPTPTLKGNGDVESVPAFIVDHGVSYRHYEHVEDPANDLETTPNRHYAMYSDEDTQPVLKTKALRRSMKVRSLRPSDFEDSDDGNDSTGHEITEYTADDECLQSEDDGKTTDDDRLGIPLDLAKPPPGTELRRVQSSLQEKIVREIWNQSREDGFSVIDEEPAEEIDRKLEILTELKKVVRDALEDGTFRLAWVIDINDQQLSDDDKFDSFSEIQLMLELEFQQHIAAFDRPYRPTGIGIGEFDLEDLFEHYVKLRMTLLAQYPSSTIKSLLEFLEWDGGNMKLEDLC